MNKLRLLIALALLIAPTSVLAQEGFPPFTTDFPPEEFAARRAKFYDAIGENGIAIIQGAASPAGYTRFRQSNEFYYLCGIEVPHAYLLLDGAARRATVYLPHRNEGRERGEGKMLSAEDSDLVRQLSGIDAVAGTDLLNEHLVRYAYFKRTVYTPLSPAEGFAMSRDLALRAVADRAADPFDGVPSREGMLVQTLRARFPILEVKDLSPTLDGLRLIKSEREIALLRRATRLSGLALMEAMRSTEPGIKEYELDAMAKYVYYRNGAQGESYYSLIASGRNAWYPHYNAGKRRMEDGDFLLMDFAPDVGYYQSDLTRMMPVNGKFSPSQRELYGFYLGCYQAILKAIRPDVTPQAIKLEAVKEMERLLAAIKFSKPIYEKAAQAFVNSYAASAKNPRTALGHWVGMATHDVGEYGDVLRAGMVFTIEPALTVPEEKVYIRLEDMILITPTKAEILSDFVPMDMDSIERLMKEEGMLQRYPRDAENNH
ncbi:MAG: aminopeptidase P N-terminal domain-containing protein [Blastocatellia bacterium]